VPKGRPTSNSVPVQYTAPYTFYAPPEVQLNCAFHPQGSSEYGIAHHPLGPGNNVPMVFGNPPANIHPHMLYDYVQMQNEMCNGDKGPQLRK